MQNSIFTFSIECAVESNQIWTLGVVQCDDFTDELLSFTFVK